MEEKLKSVKAGQIAEELSRLHNEIIELSNMIDSLNNILSPITTDPKKSPEIEAPESDRVPLAHEIREVFYKSANCRAKIESLFDRIEL